MKKKESDIKETSTEKDVELASQDQKFLDTMEQQAAIEDTTDEEQILTGDESADSVVSPASGNLKETVVAINRVTKVVSGGKRFAFAAVIVAGDGNGKVGLGKGKARDVQSAISKASYQAKKNMISTRLMGTTIPCPVIGTFGAARVMMRPAVEGTGVVAGGAIRAVLEACGVKDILTKNLGTSNTYNVIYATLNGLSKLRTKEDFAKKRGKKVEDI